MNEKIANILDELTIESELEKSKRKYILPQDRMLAITKDTGQFFNILLKSKNIRRVLEVGTSTGYSTLWFADAILDKKDSSIITIEQNSSKIDRAKRNFTLAQVSNIEIMHGMALDVLSRLHTDVMDKKIPMFDFVFIDADKENVIKYFDYAFDMVYVGGIIAIDNMLYPIDYRPIMTELLKHIKEKPNVQSVTIPIGNGEEFIIKTSYE